MISSWASAATCLILTLAWHLGVEARPSLEARQPDPPLSTMRSDKVYVMIPEGKDGLNTPAYFRNQGGLSNQPLPRPGEQGQRPVWFELMRLRPDLEDEQWNGQDTADAGALELRVVVYNSVQVRRFLDRVQLEQPETRWVWIFEIATSPNMIYTNGYAGFSSPVHYIVGGAQWTQVSRYTAVSLPRQGAEAPQPQQPQEVGVPRTPQPEGDQSSPSYLQQYNLIWQQNSDQYDPRWENYGATSTSFGFAELASGSQVDQYEQMLNRITGGELYQDDSLRTLRDMMDWDPTEQPTRHFPFLRRREPESLRWLSLASLDLTGIPDIPANVRQAINSGLPRGAECLAAYWAYTNFHGKGPRSKRGSQKEDNCEKLSTAVSVPNNKHIPPQCRRIKNIHVRIALAGNFFSWKGTWDKVGGTLEGTAGRAEFYFPDSPSAGESKTFPISFKEKEISIAAIDKLTLNAQGTTWVPFFKNSPFTIKDIQITAECSDPKIKAYNNKNVGINQEYQHTEGWGRGQYAKETVGILGISPNDWTFSPPCEHVKDIEAQFVMGNRGTPDAVFFKLGNSTAVYVGTNMNARAQRPISIRMKEVFGKESVSLSDLNEFKLYDDPHEGDFFRGQEWHFEGITFSAICVESDKKVKMNRYSFANQKVKYKGRGWEIWTGPILPENWADAK